MDGLLIHTGYGIAINFNMVYHRKQNSDQLTISSNLNIIANTNMNKRAVDFDIVYLKENGSALEFGIQASTHFQSDGTQ